MDCRLYSRYSDQNCVPVFQVDNPNTGLEPQLLEVHLQKWAGRLAKHRASQKASLPTYSWASKKVVTRDDLAAKLRPFVSLDKYVKYNERTRSPSPWPDGKEKSNMKSSEKKRKEPEAVELVDSDHTEDASPRASPAPSIARSASRASSAPAAKDSTGFKPVATERKVSPQIATLFSPPPKVRLLSL